VGDTPGRTVSCFMDVERTAAAWQPAALPLTVWRQGAEVTLQVPLSVESCDGTSRLVHWAGMQLQETHRCVPPSFPPISMDSPGDGTPPENSSRAAVSIATRRPMRMGTAHVKSSLVKSTHGGN
jgi:hypothetical protein